MTTTQRSTLAIAGDPGCGSMIAPEKESYATLLIRHVVHLGIEHFFAFA
jgi:hypothetical protein